MSHDEEIRAVVSDADEIKRLRQVNAELLAALKLLVRETELSGNHEAKDYGWPNAYQSAISAISKAEEMS